MPRSPKLRRVSPQGPLGPSPQQAAAPGLIFARAAEGVADAAGQFALTRLELQNDAFAADEKAALGEEIDALSREINTTDDPSGFADVEFDERATRILNNHTTRMQKRSSKHAVEIQQSGNSYIRTARNRVHQQSWNRIGAQSNAAADRLADSAALRASAEANPEARANIMGGLAVDLDKLKARFPEVNAQDLLRAGRRAELLRIQDLKMTDPQQLINELEAELYDQLLPEELQRAKGVAIQLRNDKLNGELTKDTQAMYNGLSYENSGVLIQRSKDMVKIAAMDDKQQGIYEASVLRHKHVARNSLGDVTRGRLRMTGGAPRTYTAQDERDANAVFVTDYIPRAGEMTAAERAREIDKMMTKMGPIPLYMPNLAQRLSDPANPAMVAAAAQEFGILRVMHPEVINGASKSARTAIGISERINKLLDANQDPIEAAKSIMGNMAIGEELGRRQKLFNDFEPFLREEVFDRLEKLFGDVNDDIQADVMNLVEQEVLDHGAGAGTSDSDFDSVLETAMAVGTRPVAWSETSFGVGSPEARVMQERPMMEVYRLPGEGSAWIPDDLAADLLDWGVAKDQAQADEMAAGALFVPDGKTMREEPGESTTTGTLFGPHVGMWVNKDGELTLVTKELENGSVEMRTWRPHWPTSPRGKSLGGELPEFVAPEPTSQAFGDNVIANGFSASVESETGQSVVGSTKAIGGYIARRAAEVDRALMNSTMTVVRVISASKETNFIRNNIVKPIEEELRAQRMGEREAKTKLGNDLLNLVQSPARRLNVTVEDATETAEWIWEKMRTAAEDPQKSTEDVLDFVFGILDPLLAPIAQAIPEE